MEERRATSQSDQYWPTEHRINTLLKEIVKRTVSIGNPFIFGYHGTRLSYNTQTDFFFWSSGQTCDKGGVFAPISISQQHLFVFRACLYLCSLFL